MHYSFFGKNDGYNRNIQDNSYFHTSAFFLRVFLPMLNYNILNLFITFVSRDLFVPSSYIKKKCVMKQKVGLKHFCGTAKHYSCLNKSTRATVRVVS